MLFGIGCDSISSYLLIFFSLLISSFLKMIGFKCAVYILVSVLSTVVSAQQTCGGVLSTSEGTLASLNYPFPLDVKTVCNWTFSLSQPLPKLVYLSIEMVEIAEEDTLTIFDGSRIFYYNGANVTGNLMIVLDSMGSSVRIGIGPNETISPRKFMASYRSTATTIYTQEHSGLIQSPVYSNRTGANMAFTWIITKKPATSIYLSFRTLSIGAGSLHIDDGMQHWSFNESKLPNDIATASANVNVTLDMSLTEPGLGFELFHAQLYPNCSELKVVKNQTEFEIDLKDLQVALDRTVRCFIIVEVSGDVVLSAGIKALDTTFPNSNTIVTLNDGGSSHSPNILVYSPSSQLEAPPDVLTSGNRLWIGYSSVVQMQPLNVSVYVTVHNSGQHLRESGSFTLPQQASNATLATSTSVYVLTVASNQQVIATVDSDASLSQDNFILFYDGTTKEELLANFTANMTFYPIATISSQLRIVANNFKGNDTFSASFVSAPKGTNLLSTERLGSFQLNKVEANSSYVWIIAPLEMNSSIEVIALTINSASLSNARFLQIYDGTGNSSAVLYTLTNSTANIVIHINSAEGAKIILQNNGNASSGVLIDASYQLQSRCEFSLNLTSSNGTKISSPNYPGFYPANAQCRWNIVTSKKMVHLAFEGVDLPPSQPLLIYSIKDANLSLITNISGNGVIDDVITDHASLLLLWSSSLPLNNLTLSTGFQIMAFPLDCGGVYNETGKEFNTPSYPNPEKNSTLCAWTVTLPPKKDDKVEIIDLAYMSSVLKTSSAEWIIHEGGSLQSPSANMSAVNQTSFLSRTNKLLIRYAYTSDSAGGSSYQFSYKPRLCGSQQLCANGLCLHDSWRCNGVNDCGDFTDETNCSASPVNPTEPPPPGVSVAAFVVVMFVMLILGAVLAIGGPIVWRRVRSQSSYQEFRNTADA